MVGGIQGHLKEFGLQLLKLAFLGDEKSKPAGGDAELSVGDDRSKLGCQAGGDQLSVRLGIAVRRFGGPFALDGIEQ